ncbi:E3 ubiquitin-protein ligase dbl4 [Elsinoe australis]|uniref:RBR-type E3 ubiquitin transferase n=1 Tax=Elsinoe australis TaxID=40998 RepID=A0A2P7ZAA5_9PEZI|nr:E3 ubiquitin-protein ligase dbl4 [Elsinoe australis]
MEDEREEEITSLSSIFPEIAIDPKDPYKLSLLIPVAPTDAVAVQTMVEAFDLAATASTISHLPPLELHASLPGGYPNDAPPRVTLEAKPAWLNQTKLKELEGECEKLWDEYGRCQILFTYIDYVQQAAERFFDLEHTITVEQYLRDGLVDFSRAREKEIFEVGSFDCGVCLEPKKGTHCHRMSACGHVFCRACLQDFYNSAITEGDVGNVTCLEPSCGKDKPGQPQKKRKAIHPRELLEIGIPEAQARRYVELKRKKKLESDKSTIYCPRTWCQAPARSSKYPPIPDNLADYVDEDFSDPSDPPPVYTKETPENKLPAPSDRLAICSNPKCQLAFCRVCYLGWHGEFARCWPRNPADLSEEEKASYDYIRQHTSPCPTCSSPVQKTMGCNHMKCFQCNTHFCYLCGAWLLPDNPYQHFNQKGNGCYMRLWELEEGDDGQGNAHFQGARRWEQEAIAVAQAAQEEEDAAVAAQAQAEENGHAEQVRAVEPEPIPARQQDHAPQRPNQAQRERHRLFFAPVAPPPGPIDPMHAMVLQAEALRVADDDEEQPAVDWYGQAEERVMGGRRRGGRGRFARQGGVAADAVVVVEEGGRRLEQGLGLGERGRGRGRGRGRRDQQADGVAQENGQVNGHANHRGPRGGRGRGPPGGAARAVGHPQGQLDAREAAALRRFVEMARNDEEDEWDSDELDDEEDFEIR